MKMKEEYIAIYAGMDSTEVENKIIAECIFETEFIGY